MVDFRERPSSARFLPLLHELACLSFSPNPIKKQTLFEIRHPRQCKEIRPDT